MKRINMYKGFCQDEFIEWMEETFSIDNYGRQLLLSVLDYAHKHEHISKDQFADFVSDLLPEVDFLEVARFCEDTILTNETLKLLGRI